MPLVIGICAVPLIGCGGASQKIASPLATSTAGRSQARTTTSRPRVTPTASSACFGSPGSCGFPDPKVGNVGARSPCSALVPSGSIKAASPGQTIQGVAVTGTITVTAPDVRIENVCVTTDGHAQLGSSAISILPGATHAVIENATVAGANTSDRSVEIAARNVSSDPATLTRDYFYNCGECVHDGPWTVNDSYIISNGMIGTADHYEDVYCNNNTVVLNHDTLLNPEAQVATVFCDTVNGAGACTNHITITRSLIAGGGFLVYPCGNAKSVGSSTMIISGSRFARCTTAPITTNAATGGYACRGSMAYAIGSGADSHGYWPNGGYYGVHSYAYCPPLPGHVWTGNVWDDSGAPVTC